MARKKQEHEASLLQQNIDLCNQFTIIAKQNELQKKEPKVLGSNLQVSLAKHISEQTAASYFSTLSCFSVSINALVNMHRDVLQKLEKMDGKLDNLDARVTRIEAKLAHTNASNPGEKEPGEDEQT
jgi:hypothetical protein